MNRYRIVSMISIIAFAFMSSSPGTTSENGPGSRVNRDHVTSGWIEQVYTPFDTLRTDLSDYIWPTNASTVITSSFADYRRTHLHEGIDISTNNLKGYPVYASRDGYVSRVFISRRGYGKMLTVRHPDGFVTMYAHLQRFMGPIDEYVKMTQKRTKRYSLETDLDPSMFPVSKGDVIAYTGNTGIGAAHLHFEVRDSSFNPINPLLLPHVASTLNDEVPPEIQMVAFTPLNQSSKVLGRNKVWSVDTKKEDFASYTLSQPVKLSGSIGISVRATDRADVLKYKTGCYRFEVSIDGQLLFSSAKNYILESEAHPVAAYYDKSLLRTTRGKFEKLYVESGNRLPFYNRLPEGSGTIETSEFEPGEHVLKIATWDLSGNESTLTTILVMGSSSTH
ncbi:MAG: M23 family metallopeptidase [Ignavibacteriales bacterium]|nr:M23 family metallopeptidase [Ignavibacteriales bacterium]